MRNKNFTRFPLLVSPIKKGKSEKKFTRLPKEFTRFPKRLLMAVNSCSKKTTSFFRGGRGRFERGFIDDRYHV